MSTTVMTPHPELLHERIRVCEARDRHPAHAVSLFRQLPDHDWSAAIVDRQRGLWVIAEVSSLAVHFDYASCGFEGPETTATIDILVLAGFDAQEYFLGAVASGDRHVFCR